MVSEQQTVAPLKLDIGCGPNKQSGYIGIDSISFPNVDLVHDVRLGLPYKDGEVDEVHTSHFVEHLDGSERVAFFNEVFRVLKVGGIIRVIVPNWSHERAYGDPTHKFPPMCSFSFLYLNKQWRDGNAPHSGYTCDFDATVVGTFDPNDAWVAFRTSEVKGQFMQRNVNTCMDIIATLTKRV